MLMWPLVKWVWHACRSHNPCGWGSECIYHLWGNKQFLKTAPNDLQLLKSPLHDIGITSSATPAKLGFEAHWRLRLPDLTSLSLCSPLQTHALFKNTLVHVHVLLPPNLQCAHLHFTSSPVSLMSLFILQNSQSRTSYATGFYSWANASSFFFFSCFYKRWKPLLLYILSTS